MRPVNPKVNQSWIFSGWTDAEAPIPDVKNWLTGKDPDIGKDGRQEEKGTTEDEMVGWHYWLNGHGFGWPPGVGEGQGGLACCSSWGRKDLRMTELLNWTELKVQLFWIPNCILFSPQNNTYEKYLIMWHQYQRIIQLHRGKYASPKKSILKKESDILPWKRL